MKNRGKTWMFKRKEKNYFSMKVLKKGQYKMRRHMEIKLKV
jgi:hypothetical protein